MDGLSIRSSDISDITGKTERGLNKVQQSSESKAMSIGSSSENGGFADTLKAAINNVNAVQKDADIKSQK